MCLLLHTQHSLDRANSNFNPTPSKPYIAKEDMLVYKVISESDKSLYARFQYKPNELYRLRKPLRPAGTFADRVNEGFHAYTQLSTATFKCSVYGGWTDKPKVVQFTIPKGARYFLGKMGDIVSTSIRSGDLQPCV
jgi:hypothetical protein